MIANLSVNLYRTNVVRWWCYNDEPITTVNLALYFGTFRRN